MKRRSTVKHKVVNTAKSEKLNTGKYMAKEKL